MRTKLSRIMLVSSTMNYMHFAVSTALLTEMLLDLSYIIYIVDTDITDRLSDQCAINNYVTQ